MRVTKLGTVTAVPVESVTTCVFSAVLGGPLLGCPQPARTASPGQPRGRAGAMRPSPTPKPPAGRRHGISSGRMSTIRRQYGKAISASHAIARRSRLRSRCLYFRPTQRTRWFVEPTEEVEQPGLVKASVVVDPPLRHGVDMRARSSRDLSLRLAMCPERISWPIAFIASALTAGRNDTKFLPCLFLASLAGTHTPGTQAVIRSDRPTKTARWRRPAGPTTATRVLDLLAIAKSSTGITREESFLGKSPGKAFLRAVTGMAAGPRNRWRRRLGVRG